MSVGVNVQPGTIDLAGDPDSLKRFAWSLPIVDWDTPELTRTVTLLQAVCPPKLWRFTQDPRGYGGWPSAFTTVCKLAVFANEPDLEGWPAWYQQVCQLWLAAGGQLAEPAWHDEAARLLGFANGRTPTPIYSVLTAHCYAGDWRNLEAVRHRSGGLPVFVTEYARQFAQQQCLLDVSGIPEDVALFIYRWRQPGAEPGYDVADITFQETPMPLDPEIQAALDAVNTRIAAQTEGLRRVVEGHYKGVLGAAAIVVELEGGNTTINPQPDTAP